MGGTALVGVGDVGRRRRCAPGRRPPSAPPPAAASAARRPSPGTPGPAGAWRRGRRTARRASCAAVVGARARRAGRPTRAAPGAATIPDRRRGAPVPSTTVGTVPARRWGHGTRWHGWRVAASARTAPRPPPLPRRGAGRRPAHLRRGGRARPPRSAPARTPPPCSPRPRTATLDAAERRRLARSGRAPATTPAHRFVRANLRLVIWVARRYRDAGLPLGDLVQEGNLGLHAGGRDLRPPQGLHVLDLRHVVDPPAHRPGPGRHQPHDPGARPRRRGPHRARPDLAPSCSSRSAASRRPRSSPRRAASRSSGCSQCLRAEPDLVSLSAGVGEDGTELGDLLADLGATAPEDAAVLAVRVRRAAGLARAPARPRARGDRAALRLRRRLAPHARGGRPPLLGHPGAGPPDRGQGAHEAAPPVRPEGAAGDVRRVTGEATGSTALQRRRPASAWQSAAGRRRAHHRTSTISAERAAADGGSTPGAGRQRKHDVDAAQPRLDDAPSAAPTQLDGEADLLGHLAHDGGRRLLAPLEQAAGQPPAAAVAVADEQHAVAVARRRPWRRPCSDGVPRRTRPRRTRPAAAEPQHPERAAAGRSREASGGRRAPRRAAPGWPRRPACGGRRARARRGRGPSASATTAPASVQTSSPPR